jgi:hypothetical protein
MHRKPTPVAVVILTSLLLTFLAAGSIAVGIGRC